MQPWNRLTFLLGLTNSITYFCLDEEAYHAIAGIDLTTENYREASDFLKNRYGNRQLIASVHINALERYLKGV